MRRFTFEQRMQREAEKLSSLGMQKMIMYVLQSGNRRQTLFKYSDKYSGRSFFITYTFNHSRPSLND